VGEVGDGPSIAIFCLFRGWSGWRREGERAMGYLAVLAGSIGGADWVVVAIAARMLWRS